MSHGPRAYRVKTFSRTLPEGLQYWGCLSQEKVQASINLVDFKSVIWYLDKPVDGLLHIFVLNISYSSLNTFVDSIEEII